MPRPGPRTRRNGPRERTDQPDRRSAALERVYGIAHDLEGQGASFGYALVTYLRHINVYSGVQGEVQKAYNAQHGITPKAVKSHILDLSEQTGQRAADDDPEG